MYFVITIMVLSVLAICGGIWAWGIYRCAKNEQLDVNERGRWMLLIFCVPVAGAAYYLYKHRENPMMVRKAVAPGLPTQD
jgi:hypothetical protein